MLVRWGDVYGLVIRFLALATLLRLWLGCLAPLGVAFLFWGMGGVVYTLGRRLCLSWGGGVILIFVRVCRQVGDRSVLVFGWFIWVFLRCAVWVESSMTVFMFLWWVVTRFIYC